MSFVAFPLVYSISTTLMASQKGEPEDDRVSTILPNVLLSSNMSISNSKSNEIPCEMAESICNILELECTDQRDQIISDILKKGRRILRQYQRELAPDTYSREINPETTNAGIIQETDLLKLIKEYIYKRWETACEKQPKIWEFIQKVKSDNVEHFEMILTRAAEYGSEYTVSSSMLSIVLQLLFTGIDDSCLLNEPKVFVDLWNSVTNGGISTCNHFNKYIAEDDLKEQMDDKSSVLHLTLGLYYREEVPDLLKQCKIPDSKNTLYNMAIESITQSGWISGIKAIERKIAPVKYEPLVKRVEEMVTSRLIDYVPSPTLTLHPIQSILNCPNITKPRKFLIYKK
ncbi:unnamed protein product [Rotaria sp. Silwood2]|nr:unnamed protein product [Rotaria sp. Silwood2]